MPKPTKGKRLGGSASHEDQIISNLISALIEHEKIETTVTKAKTVKPYAEKVITKAKSGTLHDRRQVLKMIQNNDQIQGLSPWILKDFRSMMRPLAGVQDFYNRKGLIDEDGKKKKAFKVLQQFYQDEWE